MSAFLAIGSIGCSQNVKIQAWSTATDDILKRKDPGLIKRLSNADLVFKGGLILTPRNRKKFGGLSALWCSADGTKLIAVSDYPNQSSTKPEWFRFDLSYAPSGFLKSGSYKFSEKLVDAQNKTIPGAVESLAALGDRMYLSLDGSNDLLIYQFLNDSIGKAIKSDLNLTPNGTHPPNCGIETLCAISGGKLLAIDEMKHPKNQPNQRSGWIFDPNQKTDKPFIYKTKEKEIKGATTLPGGDIAIIEKTFDGSKTTTTLRLTILDKNQLNNKVMQGRTILHETSKALDNFEGIASYQKDGKEYLLLISDDNGDKLIAGQRTLILHFELQKKKPVHRARGVWAP